jgi:hypothetical protein
VKSDPLDLRKVIQHVPRTAFMEQSDPRKVIHPITDESSLKPEPEQLIAEYAAGERTG